MAELITLGLISAQDISFGYGTFAATLLDQTIQTLNSVNLSYLYGPYTQAFSTTPTFDLQNGTVQTITLTGNVTSSTFQNDSGTVPTGAILVLRIVQDAIGSRTFAWPANVTGGSNVTVGAAANAITIATLMFNGSNWEFTSIPLVAGSVTLTTTTVTASSGAANYIPKFTGASAITKSVLYDTGNNQILVNNTSTDLSVSTNPYVITIGNNGGFAAVGATTNASVLSLTIVNGSYASINSSKTGSGTYLPLAFFANGAEQMRITTGGTLLIGGTSTDIGGVGAATVLSFNTYTGFLCATATTNASYGSIGIGAGGQVAINSAHSAGGTTLPLAFQIDGSEIARFTTAGTLMLGGTSTDIGGAGAATFMSFGTVTGFLCATATTNASYGSIGIAGGGTVAINSGHSAGGTTLPLAFQIDGSEIARFTTGGSSLLGVTSTDRGGGQHMVSKYSFTLVTAASNAELAEFGQSSGTSCYINTGHTGAGTTRPFVIQVDASEKMRLTTGGILMVGGASTDIGGTGAGTVMSFGTTTGLLCATATTNASYGSIGIAGGGQFSLNTGHSGSGTTLPMAFQVDGSEKARLTTAGQWYLGNSTTDYAVSTNALFVTIANNSGYVVAGATTNASVLSMTIVNGTSVQIRSDKTGAGSYLPLAFYNNNAVAMTLNVTTGLAMSVRYQNAKGADVASANNMTLGNDGNVFKITGATQINLLDSTGWQAGSIAWLEFASNPTVKQNQVASSSFKPILLQGSADLSTLTANSVVGFMYDGSNWVEISRSIK